MASSTWSYRELAKMFDTGVPPVPWAEMSETQQESCIEWAYDDRTIKMTDAYRRGYYDGWMDDDFSDHPQDYISAYKAGLRDGRDDSRSLKGGAENGD